MKWNPFIDPFRRGMGQTLFSGLVMHLKEPLSTWT